ncbi:hypothetical protein EJ04DRAFT_510653 [Polyplosphaeria fusca]|uniref:Uncharacterized protein n=1 Tax=Polyplosphaeria fusca TaxID=682080 RepID=A0A9P4V3P4_9PLEO|nr:hypothetical protein EJ04DRAFT_510653 [Polyplosphaeria fusca]
MGARTSVRAKQEFVRAGCHRITFGTRSMKRPRTYQHMRFMAREWCGTKHRCPDLLLSLL